MSFDYYTSEYCNYSLPGCKILIIFKIPLIFFLETHHWNLYFTFDPLNKLVKLNVKYDWFVNEKHGSNNT